MHDRYQHQRNCLVEEKRGKERNEKIGMRYGLFITLCFFFSICFFCSIDALLAPEDAL